MRVLLVTDCPVLRDALCLYLGEHGIEVVAVADDTASLASLVDAIVPDAVLVDWRCVDAAERDCGPLAEVVGGPRTPLVVGLCSAGDARSRDVAGVHAWAALGDPPAQLMTVLVEALRAWRAGDGEGACPSPVRA